MTITKSIQLPGATGSIQVGGETAREVTVTAGVASIAQQFARCFEEFYANDPKRAAARLRDEFPHGVSECHRQSRSRDGRVTHLRGIQYTFHDGSAAQFWVHDPGICNLLKAGSFQTKHGE